MSGEKDIQRQANEHYLSRFGGELRELLRLVDENDEGYEDALEALERMPLSVDALSTDWRAQTTSWAILLGTGGPADRVLVVTDFNGVIESASYQHQDWFTPWTDAENQDEQLVRRFAETVGYFDEQPWGQER